MYGMGLDIGYSQIKMAIGDLKKGEPHTLVRTAVAGPASAVSDRFAGSDNPLGLSVLVDNVPWVACGEASALQGVDRELHADYTTTHSYKALFHAALLLSGRDTIDTLVTGLPVSHYRDPAMRQRVEQAMTGVHLVTTHRMIAVDKTVVLPQPAGAYLDLYNRIDDTTLMDEGRVIVLDVGYYSADWAVFEHGQFHNVTSGSSLRAMSKLLEVANRRITKDHDGGPGIDNLEAALREGRDTVLVFGARVALSPYLTAAAEEVARTIGTAMRTAMRTESDNVDLVLLCGGGARFYQAATQEAFPRSRVEIAQDFVLANARGFWSYA